MAKMLDGAVSIDRLVRDEASRDTLQTVRAAAAYSGHHGYAAIETCTDSYHQARMPMLFYMMVMAARPVKIAAHCELAAIPYDAVAGICAAWRNRRR